MHFSDFLVYGDPNSINKIDNVSTKSAFTSASLWIESMMADVAGALGGAWKRITKNNNPIFFGFFGPSGLWANEESWRS